MMLRTAAGALMAACLSFHASADTVLLTNGDRITGTVQRLKSSKLEVATPYAGTIGIDVDSIVSIETEGDFTVILKDYSRHAGRLVQGPAGQLSVLPEAGAAPIPVSPDRVTALLPGRLSEQDWRVTGRVNAGYTSTSGNTEVTRATLDSEVIARRHLDRWLLTARGTEATERNDETEANATVGIKYDRFIDERRYAYAGSTFEHDRFKDLRLRVTLGVGGGYQAIDRAATHLALESGLDRVRTDYFATPDEANTALRLAARFDHWLFKDVAQFFHNSEMFASLDDIRDTFARTQTGLRVPLKGGFIASAQINVDWDGDPAAGRRSIDRTTILSLGYKW